MSESDIPTNSPVATELDPPTEELFVARNDDHSAIDTTPVGSGELPWETSTTGDDEWPDRGPRKGIRLSVPTVALVGLLIAAGGIWGGAALQRSHGTSSASSSTASSFASLFGSRGTGSTGGAAGVPGALGAATTGTVTEVSGSTLFVTNSSGGLVKVTVNPSATVTRNAKSSLGSLLVGDTVVVQGTKASNGSVTATSVSATGAGVNSGFGGFPTRAGAPAG
jgi:hypothetical protein